MCMHERENLTGAKENEKSMLDYAEQEEIFSFFIFYRLPTMQIVFKSSPVIFSAKEML